VDEYVYRMGSWEQNKVEEWLSLLRFDIHLVEVASGKQSISEETTERNIPEAAF